MGRPRAGANDIDTRTRILEAAVEAFGTLGHAGATLHDIAAVARITRPSLLYHFDSRERLYEAAVERVFDEIGALITAVTGAVDDACPVSPTTVLHLVDAFAAFAVARPTTAQLLLRVIVAADEGLSRTILVERAGPAIDRVVDLARRAGAEPSELRSAVTMVVLNSLARAAAPDDVSTTLWGSASAPTTALAARLLFPRDALAREDHLQHRGPA